MIIGCEYNTVPVSEMSQNKHTRYCLYCTYNKDEIGCKKFIKHTNGKPIVDLNGLI